MTKEFVPYKLALALKELGFDEPCFGYYDIKNNNLKLFSNELVDASCNSDLKYDDFKHCTAPLYQQAFRFFREKYKIRFINQSSMSDLGEYFKVIFPNGEQRGVSYNTYEEAELACLIKLIEIVKKK